MRQRAVEDPLDHHNHTDCEAEGVAREVARQPGLVGRVRPQGREVFGTHSLERADLHGREDNILPKPVGQGIRDKVRARARALRPPVGLGDVDGDVAIPLRGQPQALRLLLEDAHTHLDHLGLMMMMMMVMMTTTMMMRPNS